MSTPPRAGATARNETDLASEALFAYLKRAAGQTPPIHSVSALEALLVISMYELCRASGPGVGLDRLSAFAETAAAVAMNPGTFYPTMKLIH